MVDPISKSLAVTESGGNYGAANSEGYVGKYQFGDARLQDFRNATGLQFTKEQFRNDPALQERVQEWHVRDIIANTADLVGTKVNGVPMTQDALIAMAHLGGTGGARKYVTSGGRYNPADSNGTSLSDYANTHGGASGKYAGSETGVPGTGDGYEIPAGPGEQAVAEERKKSPLEILGENMLSQQIEYNPRIRNNRRERNMLAFT